MRIKKEMHIYILMIYVNEKFTGVRSCGKWEIRLDGAE